MDKELDDKLVFDFPNLYRNRNGDMRGTAMCWGFSCGNGWEPLIRELSEKLEKIIVNTWEDKDETRTISFLNSKYIHLTKEDEKKIASREPTWNSETKSYLETFNRRHSICASQVKEKYATLHFYMTAATDEMWKLIKEAEEKSSKICEACGKPGSVRDNGWLQTLCDMHALEYGYDSEDNNN